MKRLFAILAFAVISFAVQGKSLDSMDRATATNAIHQVTGSVIDALLDGITKIIDMIHWAFFLILIFCASMFNEAVEADNLASWLNFLKKIPRGMRTFIMGILFMVFTAWAYRIHDRVIIFETIFTILIAMATMSVGVNKIVRFVAQRFGLKFEQK